MNSNNTTANTAAQTATPTATMFNLIILDESGSMDPMTKQTISGCNEVINTIKSNHDKHGDAVRSFTSIYAFQSDGPVKSRYLVKNCKPEMLRHVRDTDYRPYGCTPLLDAVGSTLSELKSTAETHEDATGVITIMTDGYENSSTQYSWEKVAQLISWFKERGWTVNLVGANIDVAAMANQMNIDTRNAMKYDQTEEGTEQMWMKYKKASSDAYDEELMRCAMSQEQRMYDRKARASKFFKK